MKVERVVAGLAAIGAALAAPQPSPGATVQERLSALERKVEAQQQTLAGLAGIEIHALVSGAYTYSFNTPDSDAIQLRSFTGNHNNLDLNQASLFFGRQHDDEPFGFGLTLDFGKVAEGIAADWDGDGTIGSTAEERNSFELREAYLTYTLPIGDGVTLKAGKFVTLLGYEIIKTYDGFNHNISNSILFGFSIPFTHTGLLASFPLGERVSVDVGVVNGWDNVKDNNDSKTLLAGVGIAPMDRLSLYVAGTYGAEQTDDGRSKRGVVTANATFRLTDRVELIVDGTYANESDLLPSRDGPGLRGADWYGGAGYVVADLTDRISVAVRAEVFDDPDGVRTGVPRGTTVWEITPTLTVHLTDRVLARAEYRHDESSRPLFDKDSRLQTGSDTIAGELLFAF